MAKYKVVYGGKWHGTYTTQEEAERAAELESAHLDQLVFVVKVGTLRNQFVTAYPLEYREFAEEAWGRLTGGAAAGG